MLAVDTKVLIRFLVEDDPRQFAQANSIFEREELWIAKTVLLEAHWVLRSVYRFKDEEIQRAFTDLMDIPNVRIEDEVAVGHALTKAHRDRSRFPRRLAPG